MAIAIAASATMSRRGVGSARHRCMASSAHAHAGYAATSVSSAVESVIHGAAATETLTTLLAILKSVEHAQMQMHPNTTTDASLLELMNSAKIEQHKDRAVLTASIPLDLVKRLATPSTEGKP